MRAFMMPIQLLLFLLVSTVALSLCQSSNQTLDDLIRRLVKDPEYVTGFDIQQLRRSGDSAVVAALRLLDPGEARKDRTVSRMIFIIDKAFEDLELVQNSGDRIPGVALFYLSDVAGRDYSPELNLKIGRALDRLTAIRKAGSHP